MEINEPKYTFGDMCWLALLFLWIIVALWAVQLNNSTLKQLKIIDSNQRKIYHVLRDEIEWEVHTKDITYGSD